MSSPTPPTNGDTVALIGRITTTILAKGEVANVIWSPFYTQYVATGYAAVYSGPISPTPVFRSFSDAAVADLIGSTTAATRLALDALFGGGGGGPVSNEAVAAIVAATGATKTALDSRYVPFATLAKNPDALISGVITRNSDGAATSAPVVWPDGTAGTYTGTPSTSFPGAIDSYAITYGSPVTKTYTQPAVTRNADGAATAVPAIVVS